MLITPILDARLYLLNYAILSFLIVSDSKFTVFWTLDKSLRNLLVSIIFKLPIIIWL